MFIHSNYINPLIKSIKDRTDFLRIQIAELSDAHLLTMSEEMRLSEMTGEYLGLMRRLEGLNYAKTFETEL